ncbi:hypothetical protein KEM52_005518, partial [Ascosphaera acerosa]
MMAGPAPGPGCHGGLDEQARFRDAGFTVTTRISRTTEHCSQQQSSRVIGTPYSYTQGHCADGPQRMSTARAASHMQAVTPSAPADNAAKVVGQPGMPPPAPRPRGPKLKFTPSEDSLLIDLKENKHLTWKQIADFFPGRTSGTLQVRYCTKLKVKATVWTDDARRRTTLTSVATIAAGKQINRLRAALREYENDRWRLIAIKVGNGFSATACRDKAAELDMRCDSSLRDADEINSSDADNADKWAVKPDQPQGKIARLQDLKSPNELFGPGVKPGEIATDLDQATGVDRFELLHQMEGVEAWDMSPLDSSRK